MADVAPEASARKTALVVDNTASGLFGSLPPGVTSALRAAQERGDSLVLVGVDGAGAPPSRTIALDPAPGSDSQASQRARALTLECVPTWARGDDLRPTGPGSRILSALGRAAEDQPETILVVSDGVSNSGEFDLNKQQFDVEPKGLADALRDANALSPALRGKKVVWAGLGDTSDEQRLPQSARTSLEKLWGAVLKAAGATVTFESEHAPSTTPAPPGLPSDPITVPAATEVRDGCATRVSIPSSLLFAADSADLQPEADGVLDPVVDQLQKDAEATAIVAGHTANYGDAGYRKDLSTRRAQAVVTALSARGVNTARLESVGYGAERPAVEEFVNGRHDTAAAARNRRVEIEIRPGGCTR
ncbi:OmpA family protein [Cryptosporangium aurantiacum]|uniref:OmpA family protein n=1 Tax=Cryptosporangium aurantiacum TaxID=134849 RepID=UPI000935613E|nr:OmpA family protein [Cryptosporangium aurantiacum]